MSFFNDKRNIRPGPNGDPVGGLCHRVAIVATRILDSATIRLDSHKQTVQLTGLRDDVAMPLQVRGGKNAQSAGILQNLRITRLRHRPRFARIRATVCYPITVDVEDANGVKQRGNAVASEPIDIVMFVPRESVFPFEVVADCAMVCEEGRCLDGGKVELCTCTTIIIKVVCEADLLIPAYGIAPAPPASHYTSEVCREFFDLPLHPRGK